MKAILDFLQAQPPALWIAVVALLLSIVSFARTCVRSKEEKRLTAAREKTELLTSLLAMRSIMDEAMDICGDAHWQLNPTRQGCKKVIAAIAGTSQSIGENRHDVQSAIEALLDVSPATADAASLVNVRATVLAMKHAYESLRRQYSEWARYCNACQESGKCPRIAKRTIQPEES